jgi:hypothetical protein
MPLRSRIQEVFFAHSINANKSDEDDGVMKGAKARSPAQVFC